MSELVDRLTAAGAENLWPRFVAGEGAARAVVAEVLDGVLELTAEGEALLAAAKPKVTRKPRAVAEEAPVVGEPTAEAVPASE